MRRYPVWDPFVRLFHWSVVGLVIANSVLTDPEEHLHRYVGYAVAALLAIRLIWGLVGPRYARFVSFPPSPVAALGQVGDIASGRRRVHLGHTPLGALMIYNLLLTLVVVTASGYAQTTITYWVVKWVEEVHEMAVTWLQISAVIHVLAVLWESLRTGVNLPRAMVTGTKLVPETATLAE